jgi:hypothetical protein
MEIGNFDQKNTEAFHAPQEYQVDDKKTTEKRISQLETPS